MTPFRSASNPGRFMASQASVLPSGETTGAVSEARLAGVRLTGADAPSSGTWKRSKFVLQASVFPAILAEKMTERPSGVMMKSSSPPKGLPGTSPSMPRVRGTTRAGSLPGSADRAKSWLRVPSAQVSQWRTKSRS